MVIPETRLVFSQIEGINTCAAVAPANDLRQFKNFSSGIAPVITLGKLLCRGADRYDRQIKVALRIGEMLAERHDLHYAHPMDHAIGIYLMLLRDCESPYALGLAASVYSHPQFWWARKMAFEILTDTVAVDQTFLH
jgi:hypothetical protein